MKTIRLLLPLLLALGPTSWAPANEAKKPVLEFQRLDLLDQRTLRDVVIRSYDARTDKLLVVAAGKAMTISAGLVPAPFADQFRRHAPASGSTVSQGGNPPIPAGRPRPRPAPAPTPAQTASSAKEEAADHRAVAIDRATAFFRYEFKAGSDAMRVDSVKIEASPTKPVPGWPNRFRTEGKAYLEIFDTKGWSATRAQSGFEVITEKKPDEPPTVIDFSRKG